MFQKHLEAFGERSLKLKEKFCVSVGLRPFYCLDLNKNSDVQMRLGQTQRAFVMPETSWKSFCLINITKTASKFRGHGAEC